MSTPARVAVVTGAFGVLGQAVVQAAVAGAYRAAALDYAPAAPGLPRQVLARGGVDLSAPAAAAAAIAGAATQRDRLDVLMNVASGFSWEAVGDGDVATWEGLNRLNLMTALNPSRAALPFLRESPAGRIVNVGANGAMRADTGMGAYAASKAAVHRLTEALAAELKESSVTVNAVLPSILDTPTNCADMPSADFGAWLQPAALAAVMLFLASLEAQAVIGALVPVAGGV